MTKNEKFKDYFGMDLEKVLRDLRLNQEIYEKIIKITIMTTEQSLPDLDAAITQKNLAEIRKIAHELKGVYANMRVTPLCELATQMHKLAQEESGLTQISPLCGTFAAKFQQLKDVFIDAAV